MTSPTEQFKVPSGFRLGSTTCGIKQSGTPDLALIHAPEGAAAAAVFTKNLLCAAPVIVGREHLAVSSGRVHAVIVNAGNANCATGDSGIAAAKKSCEAVAAALGVEPTQVIPSSTGVIGVPLPLEKLAGGIRPAIETAGDCPNCAERFARAIMTTDTRPKLASASIDVQGRTATVLGISKGAGMIHPQMATMLAYVITDVQATPEQLSRILGPVADRTFNRISIDGDTSTNDTLMLLASGKSDVSLESRAAQMKFGKAVEAICASLAEQMVRDGEGVKHLVKLQIQGARSEKEAEQIAGTIATSALVKTAWAGADPNWGRILAAIGRSGVGLDINKVDIDFGTLPICRQGRPVPFEEAQAHAYLAQPEFDISIRLNRGSRQITYLTCDLTADYVKINADYRT
ncbi:MAG TPA: bifunctional glutamate N-acetyltransferase/amino-acid acetyltransferase ArgJ [Terriglobales bacterium]|nr:bifunctional glutamate N-acetyltransferase/amino-acid acetyltransferase ArgJ [Terriglobales bacterium]